MTHAPAESAAYGGGTRDPVRSQQYAAFLEPPFTIETDYCPANAITACRAWSARIMNQWAPIPADAPMARADFARFPVNAVYPTLTHHARAVATPCRPAARDYVVQLHDGTGWRGSRPDNFQRRRIHRFAAVDARRPRILVQTTHGDSSARTRGPRLGR